MVPRLRTVMSAGSWGQEQESEYPRFHPSGRDRHVHDRLHNWLDARSARRQWLVAWALAERYADPRTLINVGGVVGRLDLWLAQLNHARLRPGSRHPLDNRLDNR